MMDMLIAVSILVLIFVLVWSLGYMPGTSSSSISEDSTSVTIETPAPVTTIDIPTPAPATTIIATPAIIETPAEPTRPSFLPNGFGLKISNRMSCLDINNPHLGNNQKVHAQACDATNNNQMLQYIPVTSTSGLIRGTGPTRQNYCVSTNGSTKNGDVDMVTSNCNRSDPNQLFTPVEKNNSVVFYQASNPQRCVDGNNGGNFHMWNCAYTGESPNSNQVFSVMNYGPSTN